MCVCPCSCLKTSNINKKLFVKYCNSTGNIFKNSNSIFIATYPEIQEGRIHYSGNSKTEYVIFVNFEF